jgi:CRISPR/Cas system-associated endonuclease Cas1
MALRLPYNLSRLRYGVRIFIDRGRLIIEDGFANEGERRRTILSRGTCRLQRLVILGRSGVLTLDALQWLTGMGIAVLFINPDGRLTSTMVPGGLEGSKARLHRVQAMARDTHVGIRIARMLIEHKLRGQLDALKWLTDPGRQVRVEEREHLGRMRSAAQVLQRVMDTLEGAQELEAIIEAERAGAGSYWRALAGIPLRWHHGTLRRSRNIG